MEVSEQTITALQKVITGDPLDHSDEAVAPYRKGSELVDFFNQFGVEDRYGQSFPSRWKYTEDKLREFNSTDTLKEIIEAAVDRRHFLDSELDVGDAVAHLNKYLEYDGYRLAEVGKQFQVVSEETESVEVGGLFGEGGGVNQTFISEQLEKVDRKLESGDYTGAITNSRSLVEAVLREVEDRLYEDPPRYDGKLSKLYKRVYQAMNLDPAQDQISNAAREVLSGLISAISGLAPLRNMASDAHALEYRPRRHHAELAVNSAKTIVRFLARSLEYQIREGYVELPNE